MHFFRRDDRVYPFKRNSKTTGSYFQNRRWRLITILEKLCGSWPYQSKLEQYPLQLFHLFLFLTIFSAATNAALKNVGVDTNMTLECCLFMLFLSSLFVKTIFTQIHQCYRKKIYETIAKHFETLSDPEEAAIVSEGAERAFMYTIFYACVIFVLVAIFNGTAILHAFYLYLFNHPELKVQMPVPLDFGFDHRKYWYIIAIDFTTWVGSIVLIDVTYDLSFMLQIEHAKAIFKIVEIRLMKASELVDEFENEAISDDVADEVYSIITSAIALHANCLKLVKQIEECYTMSWFIILLSSTGGFGAGVQLLSTKFYDPVETFRYSSAFIMILFHFQVIFSRGQIIIDSAESVAIACYECKWYGLPKKSCKLLTMMMIRTSISCQLTGANLFPLSIETFGKMLKAGLSYYTVFRA